MIKKLLLIFTCVFLLTGCDVTYDLTIDENEVFKEKVTIPALKQDTNFETLTSYLKNKLPISISKYENNYYNSQIYVGDNYYNLIYDYDYNLTNVVNGYFIKLCFPNTNITSSSSEINVASGKGFNCMVVDENLIVDSVKVNITTELEVLENNADEVNGNTYTWNINNNNYLNKEVNIKLKKSNNSQDNVNYRLLFGIIFCILVIGGLCFFMYRRNKKINNI